MLIPLRRTSTTPDPGDPPAARAKTLKGFSSVVKNPAAPSVHPSGRKEPLDIGSIGWNGRYHVAIENGPCIVDLPIKNGDFPSFFVSLPEGTLGFCGDVFGIFPTFESFESQGFMSACSKKCKSHLNGCPKVATMRFWWCLSLSALSIFLLKFLSKSFKIVPFFLPLAPRYPVLEQVLDLMSDRTPCFTNVKSDFGKMCQVKSSEYMSAGRDHERSEGLLGLWKQWEYS